MLLSIAERARLLAKSVMMLLMKYLIALLVVVIISLAGALAYFVGRNSGQPAISQQASTTSAVRSKPVEIVTTPSPIVDSTKLITGGGILSFPRYEVMIPADWTFSRESQTTDDEKITISGDIFTITILQGGFGGSICLFPGDPDLEGPSGRYDYYQEITTNSNDRFRRVWNSGPFTGYSLCQLTQYGWNAPTLYGHISIEASQVPTSQQTVILDGVLASFTKK
ncbi:MAG TPA: hypothetical protein DIV47_03185 [Candidatus Pacebacteria bacterium]|nr:hypothetical protein [Candidatus Paceibacterota bacterium]